MKEQSTSDSFKQERIDSLKYDQFYYGNGKLLLSGEYFVLDGAQSLALPTRFGQSMGVRYSQSFNPKLIWKSFDKDGNLWFESSYEFWHFKCLDENPKEEALFLQKILKQARSQNKHFLRDNLEVQVETHLNFPLDWGLGSSSTLVYNIAQLAYISPFELLEKSLGGSGYDVACAGSDGPILFQRTEQGPSWSPVRFNPLFKDCLYFIYLGEKANSREAIEYYRSKSPFSDAVVNKVSALTNSMLNCDNIEDFERFMKAHEELISTQLNLRTIKEKKFSDYWGEVKSLGAWGGDFALVSSQKSQEETAQYFGAKGIQTMIPFRELILETPEVIPDHKNAAILH